VTPAPRVAARVALVDPDGAVLLIKSCDPELLADGPSWWHVPGGGLDPGETPAQAARREIVEEVGVQLADVGPRRATRTTGFTFASRSYLQFESFFLVRLPGRVEVDPAGWSEIEKLSTLDWRWWTPEELGSTAETVYPANLGTWLAAWTATDGPPRRWSPAGLRAAASMLLNWARWRVATFDVRRASRRGG
jgi:8-oxo-dGTP pyrophosphatase MutT (NUDIX family)